MTKQILIDPKCFDLANHMLRGTTLHGDADQIQALARELQGTCEDFPIPSHDELPTPAERRADAAADAYRDRVKEQSL